MKPRLLDLFCGAGGAAMGYRRAGFEVVGVDIEPQPRYPFEFHQWDAMELLAWHVHHAGRGWPFGSFDAIHASPPCQLFSEGAPGRKRADHPDLLTPVRECLKAIGLPYVIENVATAPMPTSILLCGATFGLPLIRHRRFEVNPDPGLVPSLCPQSRCSPAAWRTRAATATDTARGVRTGANTCCPPSGRGWNSKSPGRPFRPPTPNTSATFSSPRLKMVRPADHPRLRRPRPPAGPAALRWPWPWSSPSSCAPHGRCGPGCRGGCGPCRVPSRNPDGRPLTVPERERLRWMERGYAKTAREPGRRR